MADSDQVFLVAHIGDKKFDLGMKFSVEELKTMSGPSLIEQGYAVGQAYTMLLKKQKAGML
jgi:hypothetical protein